MLYIGAHIKKQPGSLIKTIKNIQESNGNALQLFVSNPISSSAPNFIEYQKQSNEVKDYCKKNNFMCVIHAPYTINLAKEPKIDKRMVELHDCYWIKLMIQQLIVSDLIGSVGVVVHVGKHTTNSVEDGLKYMYDSIKFVVSEIQKNNIKSKLIIETPAGQGSELLIDVNDFVKFYNSFSCEEKRNLGICIDTAHIWSAGYDINEYYDILSKTNAKDVVVIHFNNSKKNFNSKVDAHEELFIGKISIDSLAQFITKLKNKPLIILEKPSNNMIDEFDFIEKLREK